MLNVRLAGYHLYGNKLFTWLSLVMSLMASFCAVLDETWDLIESVSEGFPTYSSLLFVDVSCFHVRMSVVFWQLLPV